MGGFCVMVKKKIGYFIGINISKTSGLRKKMIWLVIRSNKTLLTDIPFIHSVDTCRI